MNGIEYYFISSKFNRKLIFTPICAKIILKEFFFKYVKKFKKKNYFPVNYENLYIDYVLSQINIKNSLRATMQKNAPFRTRIISNFNVMIMRDLQHQKKKFIYRVNLIIN